MMYIKRVLFFAAFIAIIANKPFRYGVPIEASKAIKESNEIYFTAFSKGDSLIFIHRYATDCHIMAPGMAPLIGVAGATAFFSMAYHKIGVRNGHFSTEKIYGSGNDYVTEEGSFVLLDEGGRIIDSGKYLVLWKNTPTGWKMFRDCFNSNHLIKQ